MNDAEKVLSVFNSSSSHRVGSIQTSFTNLLRLVQHSRFYKSYQILKIQNWQLSMNKHLVFFFFFHCPHETGKNGTHSWVTFCNWVFPGKSLHMNMCVFSLCSTSKEKSSRTRESSSLWSIINLYRTSASAMSLPCCWGWSFKLSFSTSRMLRHGTWSILDLILVRE